MGETRAGERPAYTALGWLTVFARRYDIPSDQSDEWTRLPSPGLADLPAA